MFRLFPHIPAGCSVYSHLTDRKTSEWSERRLSDLLRPKKSPVSLASYSLIYPHLASFCPFSLRLNGPKQPLKCACSLVGTPGDPTPAAPDGMIPAFDV